MTGEWMIALMQAADDFKHNQPTLRDQFAMAALQGYIASYPPEGNPADYAYNVARDCFSIADAMLKARAGEQE